MERALSGRQAGSCGHFTYVRLSIQEFPILQGYLASNPQVTQHHQYIGKGYFAPFCADNFAIQIYWNTLDRLSLFLAVVHRRPLLGFAFHSTQFESANPILAIALHQNGKYNIIEIMVPETHALNL